MEIITIAATALIDELTKSEVVATFSDKRLESTLSFTKEDNQTEEIVEVRSILPFTISINNRFKSSHQEFDREIDPKYNLYMFGLRDKLISEIDYNINLRIGKWDILNYLTHLEFELKEIRDKYKINREELILEDPEEGYGKLDIQTASDLFMTINNLNIEIVYKSETDKGSPPKMDDVYYVTYALSRYWDNHLHIIDRLIRILQQRTNIIENTDDYVKEVNSLPSLSNIQWKKSDTDLLELIVALNESGSIFCNNSTMTRKQTIEFFEDLFGITIKDAESKLSRATERKKDQAPFLTILRQTFENYSKRKIE